MVVVLCICIGVYGTNPLEGRRRKSHCLHFGAALRMLCACSNQKNHSGKKGLKNWKSKEAKCVRINCNRPLEYLTRKSHCIHFGAALRMLCACSHQRNHSWGHSQTTWTEWHTYMVREMSTNVHVRYIHGQPFVHVSMKRIKNLRNQQSDILLFYYL